MFVAHYNMNLVLYITVHFGGPPNFFLRVYVNQR